ncbi:MAG: mechanosensitive ion channel family protein [Holophagaceae bacterium]|nr:mechanosensitive ion channel family protein [Holophagaceae bacterium]
MFRDLREKVSPTRRAVAWGLLVLLVAGAAYFVVRMGDGAHPSLLRSANLLFWALVAFLGVRAFSFLLLDPLLSQSKTATPGFARDLIVVVLYIFCAGAVLKDALGISIAQLLGTGAIAAAVVGLSLQETLGNLFSGISLHLDPTFQEGDWVEVTGNIRGGAGRDTFIGQVEAMTWRTVQLRTENGDTDIFPNRVIAQAVVTNLYVPSGLHRRTTKVVVEPHPELHIAIAKLTQALAGIPHFPHHPPEIVVNGIELGGASLEARFWTLGWRHSRAALYQVNRLLTTLLPREGYSLLGPMGPTTPHPPIPQPSAELMADLVAKLNLPTHWAEDLREHILLRRVAPGEGIIREGDPGHSIFAVVSGQLQVVKVREGEQPYTGLFWDVIATLGSGQWFGEASMLTGAPRNATVVAETACELIELPKRGFEASLKREPEIVERLVDIMESRHMDPDAAHTEDRKHLLRQVWQKQIRSWFGLG